MTRVYGSGFRFRSQGLIGHLLFMALNQAAGLGNAGAVVPQAMFRGVDPRLQDI